MKKQLRYDSFLTLENSKVTKDDVGILSQSPDLRDGSVYIYDSSLKLAIEVALTTGRPLLLRGEPGTGKSSLAAFVARNLKWRYYEHVITARTQARDLLWNYDAVRRLRDAQVKLNPRSKLNDCDYIEPGVLWWIFDRESATNRGAPSNQHPKISANEPNEELNKQRSPHHAVLLIDEIDKADPDVPNNLLVPLGSFQFRVNETGSLIKRLIPDSKKSNIDKFNNLLIIITTNEERELPQAFLRRCVVYHLSPPTQERLVDIAKSHFEREGKLTEEDLNLFKAIAEKVKEHRKQANELGLRMPGTAEYLDAVRACRKLKVLTDTEVWKHVANVVLVKRNNRQEDII